MGTDKTGSSRYQNPHRRTLLTCFAPHQAGFVLGLDANSPEEFFSYLNFSPMPFALLSTASCGLALLLSLWVLVGTWSNQSFESKMLKQQDEIQAHQLAIQTQQQQLQAQQQQIEAAAQLQNQIGPAMLRDLAQLSVANKNTKITELLKKYGLEVNVTPAAATAPAPTKP
jgi:hypothetical protein